MHTLYKLIALSVVFGLVLSSPSNKSYNDESDEFSNVEEVDKSMDKSRTVEVMLPGIEFLPVLLNMIPKIVGLKAKTLPIVAALIKWLAPKTIFIAIGAIAAFTFCKITSLCSLAYDPVLYDLVPSELRRFVTPERLEDAQEFLISALKQYANQNIDE